MGHRKKSRYRPCSEFTGDEQHSLALKELWEDGLTEPLGHALLREAAAVASQSPRSSILIMTAALETGVKMHISQFVPGATWLMQEMQSPPVFKMLRDYIPEIHRERHTNMDCWANAQPFISKTQNLIEVRNKVAHTGKIPKKSKSVQEYLALVHDMLCLLDVLEGRDWAKTLASPALRRALGWPSPKKHGPFSFKIVQPY